MSYILPGPGDFCPGCNRILCRCLDEPDEAAFSQDALDHVVSHDYADDGPDFWPDDEDWLF